MTLYPQLRIDGKTFCIIIMHHALNLLTAPLRPQPRRLHLRFAARGKCQSTSSPLQRSFSRFCMYRFVSGSVAFLEWTVSLFPYTSLLIEYATLRRRYMSTAISLSRTCMQCTFVRIHHALGTSYTSLCTSVSFSTYTCTFPYLRMYPRF